MKKLTIIYIIIIIFIASFFVRYFPVWLKGFPAQMAGENLVLARNLTVTGEYKIEDEKGVTLSSSLIKEKGIKSNLGNSLTPIIYGKIFSKFGHNLDVAAYASLLAYALTNILLFLIVLRLFNLKIALIFSAVDIFSPFVTRGALWPGFYEWAALFFTAGLMVYLWPVKKRKFEYLNLILASVFWGLAILARNAFFISFIPFLIYDFYKTKSFKRAMALIIPLIIIVGIFIAPGYIKNNKNAYLSSSESGYSLHLFPDYYTQHFEKEKYLESVKGTNNPDLNEYLIQYGYPVSLKNKLLMYFHSIKFYPIYLFKTETLGGPFIVLFIIAGIAYLIKNKDDLTKLLLGWMIVWYLSLIVLKTNAWQHFLEIRFPLILFETLGIYWLCKFIWGISAKNKIKYIMISIFFLSLIIHLSQANGWLLHEIYKNSDMAETMDLVPKIKNADLKINDVVAVGRQNDLALKLNYLTDFNYIYFDSNTIENLIKENKLNQAFDKFGVTKIAGFPQELTKEIIKNSKATSIDNMRP